MVSPANRPPSEHNRLFTGRHNNQVHKSDNQAGTAYRRRLPSTYPRDSFGHVLVDTPARMGGPNPRTVSNALCKQNGITLDARQVSAFSWAWGQFLDHDLAMTLPIADSRQELMEQGLFLEYFPVKVPAGDPDFDPQGLGRAHIPLIRSKRLGRQAEQRNFTTGWIDASMVYGADPVRAAALRAFERGKLKESAPGFLPFNIDGLDNEDPQGGDPTRLYLAGDRRANENLALCSLQTIFLREHNRQVEALAERFPQWDDETLYQAGRKIIGALVQKITYDEYLPSLIGQSLPEYEGYNDKVDPRIDNVFAAAVFRFGHSQIGPAIRRIEENGDEIAEGHLCLRSGYHRPDLLQQGGLEPILRGLGEYVQEETDLKVIEDLRSYLFGQPGMGGLDLAAINIQRGRDHGLQDFNSYRQSYGLPKYQSFEELTDDPTTAEALAQLYQSVDDIDPWVGFLAEKKATGSSLGESATAAVIDQFMRLRDGDRFFYLNDDDLTWLAPNLDKVTLQQVILRNTDIQNLPEDVFVAADPEPFDDPCRSYPPQA